MWVFFLIYGEIDKPEVTLESIVNRCHKIFDNTIKENEKSLKSTKGKQVSGPFKIEIKYAQY